MRTLLMLMCCAVALGVAGSAQQAATAPIEWSVADGGNGHFYEQVQQNLTWQESRDAAELLTYNGLQGYMVTITSSDYQNFLIAQFPANLDGGTLWLGGFQDLNAPDFSEPAGGWRWVTGEPFVYTNWIFGEPNQSDGRAEEFLDTYVDSWGWNDFQESKHDGFYVEYPAIPEPSSFFLLTIGLVAVAFSRRFNRV